MNRPPSLPFSIVRELKCRNCQNVVSCEPVYVLPDESILCGRCKNLSKDIYRNKPFEALASMFLYPCQYWEDHCPRILRWNDCFEHEYRCSYSSGCSLFWKHPKAYLKGKRDMPYGDIRLIPVPENLLDKIKCSLCESYLSCEPVFIQSDGKNICHRCIHANGVPAESVRNIAYETLSNIIIFPCVYRNRGCPTRLKFGNELWHHEAECSYNHSYKRLDKTPSQSQKARGVIKTHSGHYYGTLTPHSLPFAPPSPRSEFDINKELVKSLKRQQERKLLKAEELHVHMRMNSEDSEDANKSFSSETSASTPTPTRLDEAESYTKPNKDQAYNNYNNVKQTNYLDNIYLAQNQEDNISLTKYYPPNSPLSLSLSEKQIFNEPVLYKGQKSALQDVDYNLLAGHYPVFVNPYGQGLIPKPSFKGVVRTDSLSSNRELMQELRLKQSKMKNKNEENLRDSSPYKECQNLEDILQVHDKISQ